MVEKAINDKALLLRDREKNLTPHGTRCVADCNTATVLSAPTGRCTHRRAFLGGTQHVRGSGSDQYDWDALEAGSAQRGGRPTLRGYTRPAPHPPQRPGARPSARPLALPLPTMASRRESPPPCCCALSLWGSPTASLGPGPHLDRMS